MQINRKIAALLPAIALVLLGACQQNKGQSAPSSPLPQQAESKWTSQPAEDAADAAAQFGGREGQDQSGVPSQPPDSRPEQSAAIPPPPPSDGGDATASSPLPQTRPPLAPLPEIAPTQPQSDTAKGRAAPDRAVYNGQNIGQTMFWLTNEFRRSHEQDPLTGNDALRWAAQIRAEEVLTQQSHTRPDDTPYHTAMDEAGYDYAGSYHGENLCVVSFSTLQEDAAVAREMFQLLAESEGHCNNILRPSFAEAGMGVAVREKADGYYEVACVQLFAGI
jgi:Uncharacterized protein with SCP/PR1 domains